MNDQSELLNATKCFYSKLYSKQYVGTENCDFYGDSTTKLNESENTCERVLTEYECANALRNMKYNTSQSSDGMTTEFYKIFWNDIKKFLSDALNFCYYEDSFSEIQTQSLINLLPKPEKDTA